MTARVFPFNALISGTWQTVLGRIQYHRNRTVDKDLACESCASSCLMLMIWSSRARNRSRDPPRPNHATRFGGIPKTKLQAFRSSDP